MRSVVEHDVAIVGGGPAGTSTALHLVREQGIRPDRIVVLDKARFPRDKPCAGAVSQLGVDALHALGVRVEVPFVAMRGVRVLVPGRGRRDEVRDGDRDTSHRVRRAAARRGARRRRGDSRRGGAARHRAHRRGLSPHHDDGHDHGANRRGLRRRRQHDAQAPRAARAGTQRPSLRPRHRSAGVATRGRRAT